MQEPGSSGFTSGSFNNRTSFNGTELKYFPILLNTSFGAIGTTPSYSALETYIVAGTDSNQRIGRSIRILWVDVCGTLEGGQTSGVADDDYNLVRLSLQGAQNGLTWVGNYTLDSVLDPRNRVGLDHVYGDYFYTLASPGKDTLGYLTAVATVRIHWNINRVFTYTGTTGQSNSPHELFFSAVSDSAAIPHPGFKNGTVTVFYTDA
jgi:hypothetical protein